MSHDNEYERVILVKPLVYLYLIPPLTSASRGFRAADWDLDKPIWNGRLRIITKGNKCFLRLEESSTGQLYCQAPVEAYPGPQVQQVNDSRRYFVIKVVSDTGRSALLGIGFSDADDAFDLNLTLQGHFRELANSEKTSELDLDRPNLDLSLKGGIRVNLNIGKGRQNSESSSKPVALKTDNSGTEVKPFLLPPPPASTKRR